MVEYNVGDKVKYIGDIIFDLTKGKIYVIIETDNGDNKPIKVIDDCGYRTWLGEDDFELVDERPVLHSLFDEWYDMFKGEWKVPHTYRAAAIYTINQLGFGHALEDPLGKDLVRVNRPKWEGLWFEMQREKEKYTRAILDDSYVLDKPKRWVLKLNDKVYCGSHGNYTPDKEIALPFELKENVETHKELFGGTIEEL